MDLLLWLKLTRKPQHVGEIRSEVGQSNEKINKLPSKTHVRFSGHPTEAIRMHPCNVMQVPKFFSQIKTKMGPHREISVWRVQIWHLFYARKNLSLCLWHFLEKKPKFGKNGKSRREECTFLPPMKGLSAMWIHGSAEKQLAVWAIEKAVAIFYIW